MPSPKLAMSRWQFFGRFFVPVPAVALLGQLEALQDALAIIDQRFSRS